jgi:hypothetical protein
VQLVVLEEGGAWRNDWSCGEGWCSCANGKQSSLDVSRKLDKLDKLENVDKL